jgi:hypothetical protein
MRTVVAQIAFGQQNGVASRPYRQLPLVDNTAIGIDQVHIAVIGLGSDQGVATRSPAPVDRDQTGSTAPVCDRIDTVWNGCQRGCSGGSCQREGHGGALQKSAATECFDVRRRVKRARQERSFARDLPARVGGSSNKDEKALV